MLSYREATELFTRFELPPLAGTLTRSTEETVNCGLGIGGPVALKAISRTRTHKAASGLLRLNIFGEDEIARAAAELWRRAGADDLEGILVQPMASGGIELFLGALVDPQFGPLVALGPGGSLVELIGGVDFLRPPFGQAQARSFIHRNALVRLLKTDGLRTSVDSLTPLVQRMANLIVECSGRVTSVDINPLVYFPDGPELITLDLRIEGGGSDDDNED